MSSSWGLPPRAFLIPLLILTFMVCHEAATAAQLTLTWVDNSANEDGFEIERMTGTTGTFVLVATEGPNTISHTDSNLASGTTYCYRVRAYNAAGDSPYSNEACGTTPTSTQNFTITPDPRVRT